MHGYTHAYTCSHTHVGTSLGRGEDDATRIGLVVHTCMRCVICTLCHMHVYVHACKSYIGLSVYTHTCICYVVCQCIFIHAYAI